MIIENKIEQLFKHRILLHVGFWVTILVFTLLGEVHGGESLMSWPEVIHLSVHFFGFIAAAYINLYILIPRYLAYRHYIGYFILVILLAMASTILTQQLQWITSNYIIDFRLEEDVFFLFFHISFYSFFLMMLTSMFYFLRRKMSMQEMESRLREAENQQVVSELKALKSQINPHFFFNTLNSIYSLSLENNPKTPEVVLKLSGLMRYILYESSTEKIALKSELEFIKNYIELEKARFENSVVVQLEVDEQSLAGYRIAPLLLIPFIENAFKHTHKTGLSAAVIKIIFSTAQLPVLKVQVENTKEQIQDTQSVKRGVGLDNVKQRLNLIYPDKYDLQISDDGNWFSVYLEIDLS